MTSNYDFIAKLVAHGPSGDSKQCTHNFRNMDQYKEVQSILKSEYGIGLSTFFSNCIDTFLQEYNGVSAQMEDIENSSNPLENVPEWTGTHECIVLTTKWYKTLTKEQYKDYDKTVMKPLRKQFIKMTEKDEGYDLIRQQLELHSKAFWDEWYIEEVAVTDR